MKNSQNTLIVLSFWKHIFGMINQNAPSVNQEGRRKVIGDTIAITVTVIIA